MDFTKIVHFITDVLVKTEIYEMNGLRHPHTCSFSHECSELNNEMCYRLYIYRLQSETVSCKLLGAVQKKCFGLFI